MSSLTETIYTTKSMNKKVSVFMLLFTFYPLTRMGQNKDNVYFIY